MPVLQPRAYDVDVVVRRVSAAPTVYAGIVIYAAIVAVLSVVIGTSGTIASTVGAAVAIAMLDPLSLR